jgi:hypothetical protein
VAHCMCVVTRERGAHSACGSPAGQRATSQGVEVAPMPRMSVRAMRRHAMPRQHCVPPCHASHAKRKACCSARLAWCAAGARSSAVRVLQRAPAARRRRRASAAAPLPLLLLLLLLLRHPPSHVPLRSRLLRLPPGTPGSRLARPRSPRRGARLARTPAPPADPAARAAQKGEGLHACVCQCKRRKGGRQGRLRARAPAGG